VDLARRRAREFGRRADGEPHWHLAAGQPLAAESDDRRRVGYCKKQDRNKFTNLSAFKTESDETKPTRRPK
jgi:hypothetical protein